MKTNTVMKSFDKSGLKDLLILEMVNQIKYNWENNKAIDFFFYSSFSF